MSIADVLEGRARWHVECADCLDEMIWRNDRCFDVLVTDPPYGVNLGTHGGAKDGRTSHVLVKGAYASTDDSPEAYRRDIVPRITHGLRVSKRGAVFAAGHMAWDLPRADAIGGVFLPSAQGRCVWGFSSLAHVLLYGQAPDMQLGCRATALQSTETAEPNGHPVPKPIGWMLWLVGLATRIDDVVLDPFCESGTTGVAAVRLGRRFVGIEKDPDYAKLACERIGAETAGSTLKAQRAGQEPLFGK